MLIGGELKPGSTLKIGSSHDKLKFETSFLLEKANITFLLQNQKA